MCVQRCQSAAQHNDQQIVEKHNGPTHINPITDGADLYIFSNPAL